VFRRLHDASSTQLTFTLDGRTLQARRGDTVAAALLSAGVEACRTTAARGTLRAPYCLMGVCFDCLVTIDGLGNCQACLVPVEEGMRVERQDGAHKVEDADAVPERA
jgi:predicted molibdopterin-dependent oxidoreductase YjgC